MKIKKPNNMTKEQIIKRVNELTENNELQFSSFHDGMFVYEYNLDESVDDWDQSYEMLEFTFFPKDTAILTHCESIEDLIGEADLSKYYNISVVGNIDSIDISDISK